MQSKGEELKNSAVGSALERALCRDWLKQLARELVDSMKKII